MKRSDCATKGKQFTDMKDVLKYWTENIEDYCRAFPAGTKEGDAPYWYNERATVSTLAGAVWRAGGLALEEYRSVKKRGRTDKPGRVDLWIGFGKQMYAIEAKQLYCRIDKHGMQDNSKQILHKLLADALSEAKCIPQHEGMPIGLVFVVPFFREDEDRRAMLRNFLNDLNAKRLSPCFMAYIFPDAARKLVWSDAGNRHVYPGVALIATNR